MVASPTVDRTAELKGVKWARAAALTSLLGLLIAWVGPLAIIFLTGIELHYRGFSIGSGAATKAGIEEIFEVVIFGALISFISLILYAVSFNKFRKVTSGYGGPMALVIVGAVGLLLILVGFAIVLSDFLSAIACAQSGATSSCLDFTQVAGAVLAIFGGLFFTFLGVIGLLIGVYRIGKRFDSTTAKVGAILSILPVVGLVAPIVIIVGMQGIVNRITAKTLPA
jgi:hypothetical protein